MTERQIRHVGDVFGEDTDKHKPSNTSMLDRKTSFNVFKNKQAPKPPQGQQALPRIGNYQPKILLEPKTSNYNREPPMERSRSPERQRESQDMPSTQTQFHSGLSKPMIIGDKDELIRIGNDTSVDAVDNPVPPPRKKRQAPEAPPQAGSSGIRNYSRSVSQRSDEEEFDMEEQGGDIDFVEGIDNPAFNTRTRSESSSSYQTRSDIVTRERPQRPQSEHISYPYIPPPDYEDEEVTLDFDEEVEEFLDFNNRNSKTKSDVYRELEGEDFGKYLEDDYEFDAPRGPHRPPAHMGKSRSLPRPGKPQKYAKQPENKKAPKNKKKQDKREANMKRNTIRDFTFSDSKIGWGDRTVKSTSAKGRYIKREMGRKRVGDDDQFPQNSGPGSYEDFLRAKNGMPLESPNSSDSGVEMGDDRTVEDMYRGNQPKQMRNGNYENKQSVWQRLTWRFKKNVSVSRQQPEPEPEVYNYRF